MQLLNPQDLRARMAAAEASPLHKQNSNDARSQQDLQIDAKCLKKVRAL
jgi:hypothetical protein